MIDALDRQSSFQPLKDAVGEAKDRRTLDAPTAAWTSMSESGFDLDLAGGDRGHIVDHQRSAGMDGRNR